MEGEGRLMMTVRPNQHRATILLEYGVPKLYCLTHGGAGCELMEAASTVGTIEALEAIEGNGLFPLLLEEILINGEPTWEFRVLEGEY